MPFLIESLEGRRYLAVLDLAGNVDGSVFISGAAPIVTGPVSSVSGETIVDSQATGTKTVVLEEAHDDFAINQFRGSHLIWTSLTDFGGIDTPYNLTVLPNGKIVGTGESVIGGSVHLV